MALFRVARPGDFHGSLSFFNRGHVETVGGLGKAAFWAAMTKSLNVFIGEDKFAIITVPASDASKEQAVALAHKLGA